MQVGSRFPTWKAVQGRDGCWAVPGRRARGRSWSCGWRRGSTVTCRLNVLHAQPALSATPLVNHLVYILYILDAHSESVYLCGLKLPRSRTAALCESIHVKLGYTE